MLVEYILYYIVTLVITKKERKGNFTTSNPIRVAHLYHFIILNFIKIQIQNPPLFSDNKSATSNSIGVGTFL